MYSQVQKDKKESIEEVENDMEGYSLPKEFIKLSLDKIRECIEILEEHYKTCVENENVQEAKKAKQRIILFKRVEKEKMKIETQIIYSNQQELVETKMREELDNYINNTEEDYQALIKVFDQQEQEMINAHKKELKDFEDSFEAEYEKKKPKPSKECLNWIRIKQYALNQDKFDKVKEASQQIEKLQEKDNKKFEEEKDKKRKAEINNIIRKQENEMNGLSLKKQSVIDMFNQTKEKNIEQIQKKYESKLKELKNYQNFEMANFDKITKGITKPCSRIQSIVSSATKIEQEGTQEEGDGDEIKGKEEYDEEEQENDNENNNNSKNKNQNAEEEGETYNEGKNDQEQSNNEEMEQGNESEGVEGNERAEGVEGIEGDGGEEENVDEQNQEE